MMRKFIALAATALFFVAMTPNAASARMGGGGGHMGGGGGHFGGGHVGGMGGGWHGNWGGGRFVGHPGFGHRAFFPRDRFFLRHRFARFHDGFFFASYDDGYGCVIPRRVWTPWGWRWRRIWVCG